MAQTKTRSKVVKALAKGRLASQRVPRDPGDRHRAFTWKAPIGGPRSGSRIPNIRELPKTISGKIIRKELREMERAKRAGGEG